MGKHFIPIIIVAFIFCSCSEKRTIFYEYNGACVTRIDEGPESRFYYGKYEVEDHLPSSYVKSTFSSFNSGLDACLRFTPNAIEIYHCMGDFVDVGNADNIRVIDDPKPNTFDYYFDDTAKGAYSNVCRVSDILQREKEFNAKIFSEVKVIYPR